MGVLWGPWGCGRAGVDPGVGQGGCEDLGGAQQKPQVLGSVPGSPEMLPR